MTKEYTHKFGCKFQKCEYDADTHQLLYPIYCMHSTNQNREGPITCHYLGKSIGVIIEGINTKVNLCDFRDGE